MFTGKDLSQNNVENENQLDFCEHVQHIVRKLNFRKTHGEPVREQKTSARFIQKNERLLNFHLNTQQIRRKWDARGSTQ